MDSLKPPQPLNFTDGNLSDAWQRWKQKWTLYAKASGVDGKEEDVRCAVFLHVIGEEGVEVFNTFPMTADEKDKIEPLLNKFENYCNPKRNVTFERYKFNLRNQKESEPIDQYVTELKNLAASCEFRDLKDELLRDRILMGVRDNNVRGRLLRETDLTLKKAIDLCRADEASKLQLRSMESTVQSTTVSEIRGKTKKTYPQKSHPQASPSPSKGGRERTLSCDRCGYTAHTTSACPALKASCNRLESLSD